MKKNYIRFLLIFALFFSCFFLISCKKKEEPKIEPKITISVNNNMDFIYEVGTENVNFKDFFKIVNEKGEEIPVEESYLDLSNVDFSKEGSFTVTINYQNETKTISLVVVKGSDEPTETVINPSTEPTKTEEIDLSSVFSKYENYEDDNYLVSYVANCLTDPSYSWESLYHVLGYNMAYTYEGEGQTYTDYIYFIGDEMYYACEYDDIYYVYSETNDSEEFYYYYGYVDYFDFSDLNELEFVLVDDHYEAVDPIKAGKYIFGGNETDDTYSKIELYIENELISKVIGYNKYTDDEGSFDYVITLEVSEYGKVEFELPEKTEKTPTPISDDTLTTHFTSKDLECNNGEVEYTADKGAFGFDEIRGAQFLQNAGAVTITSSATVENVNSVTLTVASNADAGMTVSVYVGDTLFTPSLANGIVPKTNFNENTVIEFTSTEYANGVVKVILTPNQDSKSMYISIISLEAKENIGPIGPKEVMEAQEYNEETFDDKIIRDAQKEFEGAAGLMPTGEYHVLVIPVEFNEAKFDSKTLELLEKAFNGTPSETGYNSVSSFYKESSYGKLNITFDIMNPYLAKNTVKYYKDYFDDENELEGDSQLLLEALEYYDNDIDYNQYDIDKDGFLDGVYILYSCDVDYGGDSIYWAYVTQYVVKDEEDNKKFDGLEVYYYMFAGANFVYEDIDASDYIEIYEKMPGLKANALTFIHESGHMFGLDDYYDYDEKLGSNLGIGGSFMMGSNYGDHDPYSKTILGWINPEVVVENGTYTLNDFEEAGDTLLIPLKFNNSYFSEYLLIQLYTDNKLNEFFKDKEGYQIFEGAEYGVAVFFVSSELIEKTEDINDKYYCLTKYNNSTTSTPLIWLLEADGEQHFESNYGVTSSTDLWRVGDSFSKVFPEFSRSDGKLVNFDFEIVSLTDGTSEIKVTFNE